MLDGRYRLLLDSVVPTHSPRTCQTCEARIFNDQAGMIMNFAKTLTRLDLRSVEIRTTRGWKCRPFLKQLLKLKKIGSSPVD
jgi:hypothetical protein